MEDFIRIKAESREEVGKKISKRLRKQGKIPAIIYGEKSEAIPVSIALNEIKTILKAEKGENTVLKIQRDDIEVDAMIKEVQYNYLGDHVIHADFLRIDVNKPVTVWVPITIKGESVGVKLEDGIFEFITRDIQLKCLPTKIPNELTLDVSGLHASQTIKAGDLQLGEGIRLITDPIRVICAVVAKAKAEEEAAAAVGEAAAAEAPGEPAAKKEPAAEKKP